MIQYWEMRGQKGDMWIECPALDTRWYEDNCTVQPGLDIAIWEPCNYVSNLAYDRCHVPRATCASTRVRVQAGGGDVRPGGLDPGGDGHQEDCRGIRYR